ncbi:uncharacterized protein LOC142558467 [Dermacentor variabilis]|uniref:uncharacterized protein LOC142558467 n=1 Tax=Dermacentor variabilis TaxID=34621 RepID=UPI003F5B7DE3
MALRIFVGCCIFGVGWYAVDKVRPGLLPQIDVAGRIAALRSSAEQPAIEDKEGKDTKDTALKGTGVGESGSATQGLEAPAGDLGVEPLGNIDDITARLWSRVRTILSGHMMDALVSIELQHLVRATWTAVQDGEWVPDVGYDKACLLLASILCLIIATWCCKGGSKKTTSNADTLPANPIHGKAVDWKSNFSISDMARLNIHGHRHEGGYIYPRGIAAAQLSKEDAAAAVIQRWARTEFKRWLLDRPSSRSSTDTPPPNSQRWIDEDYGAVVSTLLEDSSVSVDALGPPEGEHCPANERPPEKRLSERKYEGGDDADSRPDIRCRRGLSLSSAKLSKAVLRLKSPAVQHTAKGPASTPP